MKKCPSCGHESDSLEKTCSVCGKYYSKIIELIDEEAENEEKNSFQGCFKRVLTSDNRKQQAANELKLIISGLSRKAKFTLFIIAVFIFALVVSVL